MKVLLVGGGGREHTLAWKLKQSPKVDRIFCAPGNAGISQQAELVNLKTEDIVGLKQFALKEKIDLTIVGPEAPLTLGIVDEFQAAGLNIFGPSRAAARLEGSKSFTKDLMAKYNVPSGFYRVFDSSDAALAYLDKVGVPIVIKADGLAAGKGVLPCTDLNEAKEGIRRIMVDREFGAAGDRVVIEEFLEGEEASFLAFTDGRHVVPLATSQDHKPIYDNDEGPNTGGMGAYSPAPVVTPELFDSVMSEIMLPVVRGMEAEGAPYRGVLYAGLMIKDGAAKVLEFNARFGDPEAQPLLMRLQTDLAPILYQIAVGESIADLKLEWDDRAAVCVVMASGGYPGKYEKGKELSGLDRAAKMDDVMVFHAGTAEKNGKIVTAGGRVLGVTALGSGVAAAIDKTYAAVDMISWENEYHRTDIGRKALTR